MIKVIFERKPEHADTRKCVEKRTDQKGFEIQNFSYRL
jgi:hypothetical protein